MQKTLIYIVSLLVLGALAFLVYSKAPRLPDVSGSTTATSTSDAAVKTETATYTVNITYHHTGSAIVDAKIDAAVKKAADAFAADAAQMGPPESGFPKYSLQGKASAMYVGNDFTSERVDLYQDTGGAHGLPIILSLNYDSKSGAEVSLDQVLGLIGMTLPQVSAKALTQLHQSFGESVFEDGAAPRAENYGTFIIGPYNVTFIFQAYQVVAFAAGMPEVSFARK